MHAWVVVAIVMAGLLIIPSAFTVYGTLAKNKWGINLHPVSCPRCGKRVTVIREPRSQRQAKWGNWTCPGCGIEVDKWGREIAPVGPGPVDSNARCKIHIKGAKRAVISSAPVGFCIFLLYNLSHLKREPFPLTWNLAVSLVGPAILETGIICLTCYFGVRYFIIKRYSKEGKGYDSVQANESDRTPKA